MLKLMFKSFLKVIGFCFIIISCKDCLNLKIINERTDIFNTWQTDSELTSKTVNSSIEISEEISLTYESQDFGDAIWDDCGRITESFKVITNYEFFIFPFQISSEFYKQGEENGFEFIIYNNEQRLVYNFITKTSKKKLLKS